MLTTPISISDDLKSADRTEDSAVIATYTENINDIYSIIIL